MPRRKYPDYVRKQFYDTQDRRCPVCEIEIEYGAGLYEDKPSGKVLCRGCWLLVHHMRKKKLIVNNAVELVCNGCINGKLCNG